MAFGDGIRGYALNLLQQNPNIANNPTAQSMVNAIQNNDSKTGMQLADNICKTYGISREQAIAMAKDFFRLPG